MQNTPSSPPMVAPASSPTGERDTSGPSKPHGTLGTISESPPSSQSTTQTANTEKPLTATSKHSDLETLRLYLSLLAGYLAKIQAVKRGRVHCEEVTLTQPSGKKYKVLKILIGVDDAGVAIVEDGSNLTFDVVEKEVVDEE